MSGPDGAYAYIGSELELFERATNWKAYLRRRIAPYLGRDVLEVGAGHGGTTRALVRPDATRWVCLEPDAHLAARIEEAIAAKELPAGCKVVVGTLDQVEGREAFDAVLYIDVLEHIEDDRGELVQAAVCLRPGGHLVVLSPAHPWLFTPFDRAIGHFRRYTRSSLRRVAPPELETVRLDYLDAAGMLASLGNRLILRSAMPSLRQIQVWDGLMVPASRLLDPLLGYRVGKSVLGVWRKRPASR